MWRDLGAIYGEPLFWLLPVASVCTSAVAFMLFAAPMTWLAARATDAAFGTLSRGYLEDVETRHPWVRRLTTWSQR
jgi:hypothetical protein